MNPCQTSPWKCSTSHLYCVYSSMTRMPPYTMLTTANKQVIKRGTIEPCLKRRKESYRTVRGRSVSVVSREGRERRKRGERWKQ